tara:strand:+ start:305 stop:1324 length:1020 start_codon:yes stop_codon:yes gene_type:complete
MLQKPCYILGIESSCDDTAAAILKDDFVLSNIVANQQVHMAYGGVVPELASREHQKNIIPVVNEALKKAKIKKEELSAIAFTRGPGLLGSLLVGSSFAKSLSMGLKIPLIEVNHLQSHILAHFIEDKSEKPNFPFLGITLSGGHTQIVLVNDYFNMEIIGTTIDDAIGEAFDKCGKTLGLNYPAGPEIDRLSKKSTENTYQFPIPNVKGFDVSYSGFKTSVINFINKSIKNDDKFIKNNLPNLCFSIQYTLIEIILKKIKLAVKETKITTIAIGGGVSANSHLRMILKNLAIEHNWKVFLPKLEYTTDNAAMIGIVGYLKYLKKDFSDLAVDSKARLKM